MKKILAFLMVLTLAACTKKSKIGYTVPVVDPSNTYDNRSVGVSANDFLSAKSYKAINVEICYVNTHAETHKLPDSVITGTVDFLNKYCNKPGGVKIFERGIPAQGGGLTIDNLVSIEKVFRSKFVTKDQNNTGVDTISIFILVTDGDYAEKDVLGLAYKNTSAALFDGIISAHAGESSHPTRTSILLTVLQHELGHILGLVNAGTELQSTHQDDAHGKHCDNVNCLMHHYMQKLEVINYLVNNPIPVLDSACEADLKLNGSK